jgi:hypothetical protein
MSNRTKEEWEIEFFDEYRRRVGISYAAGGGKPRDVFAKMAHNYTPSEAVTYEIEKYDLTDQDTQDTWVSGRTRAKPR